jgi:hypothetical protein
LRFGGGGEALGEPVAHQGVEVGEGEHWFYFNGCVAARAL